MKFKENDRIIVNIIGTNFHKKTGSFMRYTNQDYVVVYLDNAYPFGPIEQFYVKEIELLEPPDKILRSLLK